MTLSFDTLQGFWLLLALPLLWFLQRRRAKPEPVAVPFYPVVAPLLGAPSRPPPRIFRLGPKSRWLLGSAALVLLLLAFNAPHLEVPRPAAEDRLVVLDNPSGFAAPGAAPGESIRDQALAALRRLADTTDPGDSLAVLVTSPRPRLFTRGPGGTGLEEVWAALPAAPAPPPARLVEVVERMSRGRETGEILVLTPRGEEWRRALFAGTGERRWRLPPVLATLGGNAGITDFDLRPSPDRPGSFDLFFCAGLALLPRGAALSARLESAGSPPRTIPVPFGPDGTARVEERGLPLQPGPFTLALAVEDALPADDRVTGSIRPPSPISYHLAGSPHPFLEAALRADPMLAPGKGGVEIVTGTPGPGGPEGPTLVIRPEGGFWGFRALEVREYPGQAVFHPTHPVTRDLAFDNFRPARAPRFRAPPGVEALARAGDLPLLFAGEVKGRRVVVWGFDPIGGGIFRDPSFLILLRSSLEWLADASPVRRDRGGAGDNLLSPEGTAQGAEVSLPDLTAVAWPPSTRTVPLRVDLAPWLLGGALLILGFRALALLFPAREDT